MENRIKEQQLGLFSDRTSCHAWWANQFRLLLSSLAYVLLETLRRLGLSGTELARAQVGTIRLRPTENRRGHHPKHPARSLWLSSSFPLQQLFAPAWFTSTGELQSGADPGTRKNNGGFGGVSSDAAPAASFSPLFGKTLRHQLLTYPASAQTTIWCKKRVRAVSNSPASPRKPTDEDEPVPFRCCRPQSQFRQHCHQKGRSDVHTTMRHLRRSVGGNDRRVLQSDKQSWDCKHQTDQRPATATSKKRSTILHSASHTDKGAKSPSANGNG